MKTQCLNIQDERKLVAELIFKVLAAKLCVREVLEKFPSPIEDDSLQCIWHALVHFEADEDIRKKDIEYAEEQDNYLETLAFMLQTGESLPRNIIEEYNKYYGPVIRPETTTVLDKIKSIFRFII